MLQYERIDISEGIDPNKSNKSKESNIGYKYEPYVIVNVMIYQW